MAAGKKRREGRDKVVVREADTWQVEETTSAKVVFSGLVPIISLIFFLFAGESFPLSGRHYIVT